MNGAHSPVSQRLGSVLGLSLVEYYATAQRSQTLSLLTSSCQLPASFCPVFAELEVGDLRVPVSELLPDVLRQTVGRILFTLSSSHSSIVAGFLPPAATEF